jgi:hypothetical protein
MRSRNKNRLVRRIGAAVCVTHPTHPGLVIGVSDGLGALWAYKLVAAPAAHFPFRHRFKVLGPGRSASLVLCGKPGYRWPCPYAECEVYLVV